MPDTADPVAAELDAIEDRNNQWVAGYLLPGDEVPVSTEPENGADVVLEHITECTDAKALIVVDGNADEVIAGLVAAGWGLGERVDRVTGKRIRFLTMPERKDQT